MRERIVVDALAEVWASIDELLGQLDEEEWESATPCPGWDVRAIVSHVIGTELEMSGEPIPDINLDRALLPQVHNDTALVSERWIESLRSATPELMREHFSAITARRLDSLRSMSEHEWATATFYPLLEFPYEHVIYIRVLDCWIHEQDIRDATTRPGHESGLAVDTTLDAMSVAMGAVVGTNAGIERGNSVTFALTHSGRVVREIHVEVGDEAEVVPALDGPATTKLTMSIAVWTRRCAGRVAPDAFLDRIAIEGDPLIAERVLANSPTCPDLRTGRSRTRPRPSSGCSSPARTGPPPAGFRRYTRIVRAYRRNRGGVVPVRARGLGSVGGVDE